MRSESLSPRVAYTQVIHISKIALSLRKHAYSNILKILPQKNESF